MGCDLARCVMDILIPQFAYGLIITYMYMYIIQVLASGAAGSTEGRQRCTSTCTRTCCLHGPTCMYVCIAIYYMHVYVLQMK